MNVSSNPASPAQAKTILDADVASILIHAVDGPLSIGGATDAVLSQLEGRCTLRQAVWVAIDLLRDAEFSP